MASIKVDDVLPLIDDQQNVEQNLLLCTIAFALFAAFTESQSLAFAWLPYVRSDSAHVVETGASWFIPFLLAPAVYRLTRCGDAAVFIVALAAISALALQKSFRGAWIYPGTFDRFEENQWPWLLVWVACVLVPMVVGTYANWRRGHWVLKSASTSGFVACLVLAMLMLIEVVLQRRGAGGRSVFAPTRHLALFVVVILSTGSWCAGMLWRKLQ